MLNCAPLVFMILDGFGYSEETAYNAIKKANTPQWDTWWKNCPHILLNASGTPVGLPKTQMGNSEVGHMHIGAGRIIPQDFTRINNAIENHSFAENPIFIDTIKQLKQTGRTLHIMGLLSPGGVHSHESHLFAFLDACKTHAFDNIALHLFLDGRDTPPKSAKESIHRLEEILKQTPKINIASITGRYYALDRDKRWERIEPVYRLLTEGKSTKSFTSAEAAITSYYADNISDEFIPPTQINQTQPIQDNDAVFFFNFRADRARQLTSTFVSDDFSGFTRTKTPKLLNFISMTHYADHLKTDAVFPPLKLKDTLGEVLANHHLRQLRIAETEKYAHVTFFFNGGTEKSFPKETRTLIPSPHVKTYDLQPEMSAKALTDEIIHAIQNNTHDVIICNYANADMVGHTGNFDATVKAINTLDISMHAIGNALKAVGGELLITADHGNAEAMFNTNTKQPHTAHTTNPVPLLYVGPKNWQVKPHKNPSLIDIAPTILTLLGINPPSIMEGRTLLTRDTTL